MGGVIGVRSVEREVARLTYFGLFALQHRGQESAGIAVSERGRVTAVREMGLVPQVFDEEKLSALPGEVAIGHTRYSTTGGARWANAQPVVFHGSERTVALCHNGNLVNPEPLRDELVAAGVRLASTSDTEVIAALLARDSSPLPEAVAATMRRLEGAYSVVAIADGVLVAFRDPLGIRPLTLGQVGDDWVVASETCALDLVGADVVRDVAPGEPLAHAHTARVDARAVEDRVGSREVDVLEDARGAAAARDGLRAVPAVVVDPDELAGRHVPHDVGADEIERARLGRDDPVVTDLAESERPDAERIPEGDQHAVGDRDGRIGAFEPAHRGRDGLGERRRVAAEQRGDHLRVGGRRDPDAGGEELVAQRRGIYQVLSLIHI